MQPRLLRAAVLALAGSCAVAVTVHAAVSTDEQNRLNESTEVMSELRAGNIPANLWDSAHCVVVIPGMKKAAFVIGGSYGKGVMSCRTPTGWSAPVFMELEKGSWGLQIGAESVDLVLLVMDRDAEQKMLSNKISLGADASIAAGPAGGETGASTTQNLASIIAYSRATGAFAGIDLSGGVLKPDESDNRDFYGRAATAASVVNGSVAPPPAAMAFVHALTGERATTGTIRGRATGR